jgi:hypothetical protein
VRRQLPIEGLVVHQLKMLALEALADLQRGIVEL